MIKDQIESIDEQTAMTAPISTIHHAHPQLLPANNSPMILSTKWKQNSLQRLDEPSQEKKSKFSSVQRVSRTALSLSLSVSFVLYPRINTLLFMVVL